jgi:ubiquinone/menaquinone biosynthesis C-methylase UbiE
LGIGSGSRVLDLAAGTGKLTRQLVATGADLVAVEPAEGMRRKLVESLPHVDALAGTAEAIPLGDASVDAVLCAQAFHWFDGERALAEIHRVLRPGGGLGLIWNVRDEAVEWERKLSELLGRYDAERPRFLQTPAWRNAFAQTPLFTPLEERDFRHTQEGDVETMVARVASISFIAALPEAERASFLADVKALLEPQESPLVMHYRTEVYWCRRRD